MKPFLFVLVALATLFTLPAWAHDYQVGSLTINHPWSRATPPGTPTGGGFMTIHNAGEHSDRLIGAASPFTQSISIHQTTMEDGTMRMMPLHDGLEIPAGGSVELKPGSYHLMLMGMESPLVEGEKRMITLKFEQAGEVEVELQIDAIGAMPEHDH